MNHRRAFSSLMAGGAVAGSAIAYYARHVEPYRPRLERVSLPVPEGHAGLAGLRIGFVTDTHVGPHYHAEDLDVAMRLMMAERPDLLLLGGDYVSEATRHVDPMAEVMARYTGLPPLGTCAVLGNHDLGGHAKAVTRTFAAQGVPLLRNDVVEIAHGGDALWVAGVDETLLGQPDPSGTFAKVPEGAAALCLWHEPDRAEEARRLGAFAQLSGHTHGGQVRFPKVGALVLPPGGRRYVIGMEDVDGMPLYVSRGVGVYRPPVRFRCPPK